MLLIVRYSKPFPHPLQTVIPGSLGVLGEMWEDQKSILVGGLLGVLAGKEAVETG
jgi:hypothetical protein